MAMAIVIHRPYIIPLITRLKSLAPRTSPYNVAPQFGHAIQNIRKGMRARVLVDRKGDRLRAGKSVAAVSMCAWYAFRTLKRFDDSWLKALSNPLREPNSMTRMITANPTMPM